MVEARKINVLLVHPDPAQRRALAERLGSSVHILPFSTLDDAIAVASTCRPDAVVTKVPQKADDLRSLEHWTVSHPAIPLLLMRESAEKLEDGTAGAERLSSMLGPERVLVIPGDNPDCLLIGLHVLLASEYLPPAIQAILDTFCQGIAHPFLALDRNLRCVYANTAAARYTGFMAGELIGKPFYEIFPDAWSSAIEQRLTVAATLRIPDQFEFFLKARRIWLEQRIFHWRGGISLLMAEVTDRKNIKDAGTESRNRSQLLQSLATELTQTGYRERRRLAQMLHDNLLQLLVAARMRTGMALAHAPASPSEDLLKQVDSLLLESIEMCRSMMFEFAPRALDESGLTRALQSLARHMQQRYGLQVEVSSHAEFYVPPDDRILLFETARELLFNVLKHSGKAAAAVSLASKDSRLLLRVEDKGRGFDVDSYLRQSSETDVFGLFSIKQRLELVGGDLEINSDVGRGTAVQVTLPVRARPEN